MQIATGNLPLNKKFILVMKSEGDARLMLIGWCLRIGGSPAYLIYLYFTGLVMEYEVDMLIRGQI